MIHILVHDKKDTVGVIVVEGIKAGQELTGWVMEDDSTIKVKALNDIPIGHKVATRGHQERRHRHQVRIRHRQGGRRHQDRRARPRAQHQDQALVRADDARHFVTASLPQLPHHEVLK